MAPITDSEALTLPQEIVNLIVDEVSQTSPETLRACALVSKSFSSPSRRQLFSEIQIIVDEAVQPRAKRLIKVLERGQDVGLMAFIRSLKVVLVVPSQQRPFGSSIFERSKQMATNIAKNFPRENYLLKLLSLFVNAPLTSLALDGRGGYPNWEWVDERMNEIFRRLCTNSSLKSLQISKVYNLEETLVGEVVRANTLQELSLIAVSQRLSLGNTTVDSHAEIKSRIGKLDITRLSYRNIFRIFGHSTDPLLPSPYPFVSFSNLHTLVITISSTDQTINIIWEFILGIANTLESLEIDELGWQEHIRLGQLTSLQNLKITSSAFDFEDRFDRNKRAVCQLLSSSSPSSPSRIRSLRVELNVQILLLTSSAPTSNTVNAWSELDDILTNATFVNLQHVDLDFQFFFYLPPASSHESQRCRVDFEDASILPQLSTHPSIQFEFKTSTVHSPQVMGQHLYS